MCQVNGPSCSVKCDKCGNIFREYEDECPWCKHRPCNSHEMTDAEIDAELRENGIDPEKLKRLADELYKKYPTPSPIDTTGQEQAFVRAQNKERGGR